MNSPLVYHKRLSQLALLGAVLVLIYSIYLATTLLGDLHGMGTSAPSIQHQAVPPNPSAMPKTENYAQIASWHLFGNPAQAKKDNKPIPVTAPETHLKLELLGIFFDKETKEGWAIIAEQGKPDKTYKVNDTISGNAVIQSIESDRVILERNNRFESLSLKKYPE